MASTESEASTSGCIETAMPMMKSSPQALRMRLVSSVEKRMRFSKLPPQRSSRRFDQGVQNWSIRA